MKRVFPLLQVLPPFHWVAVAVVIMAVPLGLRLIEYGRCVSRGGDCSANIDAASAASGSVVGFIVARALPRKEEDDLLTKRQGGD